MALMEQTYDLDPLLKKQPGLTTPALADPATPATPLATESKLSVAPAQPVASTIPEAATSTPTTTPAPTSATPPRTVDASRETVAGQLDSILKAGGPLREQAEADARGMSNARGLVNSTMATTAGLDAVLRSALPIASADAGVYGDASRDSYAAQTQANRDRFIAQTEEQSDARRQTFQQDNMRLASALDTGSRERLMAIEQNYRQITNGSNQAGALLQDMQSRIGAILANPQIPAENKQGLINQMIESSMRSATLIGAIQGIDFSDIFGTTPP